MAVIWLVFSRVRIVLAGIFGPIWTTGRYFWTNLDYWPVFLDQFGLVLSARLAGIFTSHDSHWPVFFDKFGLVLNFGWY